ncbi:synaptotagmin-12 [Erinaceus europaeus]|uniref:Synaptotagmin-12 n=1 Tax=Erinaceus europaeus TaxID=9365 RepID=A0ABM3WVV8_ERIEU|nr:synaptotagmin-12 [Erinaceus europaeus]XP_060040713.1 synaptotagmin-12 [Erinaceus europaeus]
MAVDVTEYHLSVIQSPPGWEVGVYAAGALALLGITAVSLWKLWTSGSFPSPSPFPNYDYRYLQQKYGETYEEARQKRVAAWNTQRASTQGPLSRKGSLGMEDTLDSISELGPLELMGRELDLAPYGPLRKSQSADSLNSVSSVSNTFGQDFPLGQVEVGLDYDCAAQALRVALLQGKDLLEREEAAFASCFMRVSLLPDEQIVGISRVSGGTALGAGNRCPSPPPPRPGTQRGPRAGWGGGRGGDRATQLVVGSRALEPDCWGSNPAAPTSWQHDPEEVASACGDAVPSSVGRVTSWKRECGVLCCVGGWAGWLFRGGTSSMCTFFLIFFLFV